MRQLIFVNQYTELHSSMGQMSTF